MSPLGYWRGTPNIACPQDSPHYRPKLFPQEVRTLIQGLSLKTSGLDPFKIGPRSVHLSSLLCPQSPSPPAWTRTIPSAPPPHPHFPSLSPPSPQRPPEGAGEHSGLPSPRGQVLPRALNRPCPVPPRGTLCSSQSGLLSVLARARPSPAPGLLRALLTGNLFPSRYLPSPRGSPDHLG